MPENLSHITAQGDVVMVDVGEKPHTLRRAVVQTRVELSKQTYSLLEQKALPKGDVLTTAQIAGIMAAKRTAELIPMCHPIILSKVDVVLKPVPETTSIEVTAEAHTIGPTGVEMEALVAAQIAALTIYDMCKAVQRDIRITDCVLIEKTGGNHGNFHHTLTKT